jgi:hypothetical protein
MKQKALEWAGPYGVWCPYCDPEPDETHINLPFCFITLPSEPALNAAGRTSDHPFKDLRSARRTHQRSKKYSEHNYGSSKRRRSGKMRPARIARLKDTYRGIESREWECDWYAKWEHNIDVEHMDVITAYSLFGKNADLFEGRADDSEITTGETFSSWARRRIAEMRRVKEHRIHKYGTLTPPKPLSILPHSMRNDSRPGRVNPTILTAPFAQPYETTLPTTLSDIRAHLTLTWALTPSNVYTQYCRSRNKPALPIIDGYGWWGEYAWQWHRNMSGCWFLDYEYDCREGSEQVYWGSAEDRCYCEEFGVGRECEVPAPEDGQRCSLVECVGGELRGRMEDEEVVLRRQWEHREEEVGWNADLADEWELVHSLEDGRFVLENDRKGSETWSIISEVDQEAF